MKVSQKVKLLIKINPFKMFYYNFLCNKVKRMGKGLLLPCWHSVINLQKYSSIVLHDSNLFVNYAKPQGSKAEAYVLLRENAILEITGSTYLCYKSTIEVHNNAKILIGGAYINTGAVILAAQEISIGKDNLISREVFIYDADHHPIVNENNEELNPPKPVIIEDHVWIGLKSTILRGAKIETGALIAPNSVVSGKIKGGTMAQGNPARSYSEVKWKTAL